MTIAWKPQPKQVQFMQRPEYEALYGGAAGGGKSDALLAEALRQVHIPKYRGLILRKTYPQLSELIDRSQVLYKKAYPKARYNGSKHYWAFPSGAKIYFGAMHHKQDRTNYQGRQYDFIGFDELTHFSWEEYSYMFSRNRPSSGEGTTRVYIRATANPGGIGHGWVKERFIEAAEPLTTIWEESTVVLPDGTKRTVRRDRVFVPSSVFDNPALLEEDPNYLGNLALLPEKDRNALLYGDWDSYTGQFFSEFRVRPDMEKAKAAGCLETAEDLARQGRFTHVIEPLDMTTSEQRNWTIMRSYDWGYAHPFSLAWWAVDYEGRLYRILELYGCTNTPNEGVRWTTDQQFQKAAEIERTHPWLKGKNIVNSVADPSCWAASTGVSTAETAAKYGIYFSKADNQRIPGWMQVRYRLQFDELGYPQMYIFSNCKAFIRTMPQLLHSETVPEDLNTEQEDHVADDVRYMCMSRPIAPVRPVKTDTIIFNPFASTLEVYNGQY